MQQKVDMGVNLPSPWFYVCELLSRSFATWFSSYALYLNDFEKNNNYLENDLTGFNKGKFFEAISEFVR